MNICVSVLLHPSWQSQNISLKLGMCIILLQGIYSEFWANHLPNMKVLKTIYIKSRQPFLCKQKKWLLGHSIICLEIIVSQYVVDTFVFSFFMFSFVVSVHNIPISSVEFWQVMSDNQLAHSLHFCNFFLFQCSCSFHLFLFISFLFN